MNNVPADKITCLTPNDKPPFKFYPAEKESPFFLVSDHAGRMVPAALGNMGLSAAEWERHIAYDIGIREVGEQLREKLGCVLIEQVYSRLVIDCNRAAGHLTSIPSVSDEIIIPANADLSATAKQEREEGVLHPYHREIERHLEARDIDGTIFVSLHSFTPEMKGQKRPWDIGLLHDHDSVSAHILRRLLEQEGTLCIGDNEPYILNAQNEYTVPYHAAKRGLAALEIEIRQDLIQSEEGQREWAERLARLLPLMWKERKGVIAR